MLFVMKANQSKNHHLDFHDFKQQSTSGHTNQIDPEEFLQQLKEKNVRMHIAKIIKLIAIKIEEKFSSVAKAFLHFDVDDDRKINRAEFSKGLEGLRVKLSKQDMDKVFDYLDQDQTNFLDFSEFCSIVQGNPLDGSSHKSTIVGAPSDPGKSDPATPVKDNADSDEKQ